MLVLRALAGIGIARARRQGDRAGLGEIGARRRGEHLPGVGRGGLEEGAGAADIQPARPVGRRQRKRRRRRRERAVIFRLGQQQRSIFVIENVSHARQARMRGERHHRLADLRVVGRAAVIVIGRGREERHHDDVLAMDAIIVRQQKCKPTDSR
ncbi:hypothetical protein ACVIQT_001812 [Bradyrhizobium diazoefficiens]